MAQIPADAQRSDDGQWWWDGSQWQPVGDQAGAGGAAAGAEQPAQSDAGQTPSPAGGQLSDDGQWQWDGSQWQPVQGAAAGAASGAEAGASSGAAAGAGPLDPSEFPTLAALSQSNPNDFDSYLQTIGIDPSTLEEAVS